MLSGIRREPLERKIDNGRKRSENGEVYIKKKKGSDLREKKKSQSNIIGRQKQFSAHIGKWAHVAEMPRRSLQDASLFQVL